MWHKATPEYYSYKSYPTNMIFHKANLSSIFYSCSKSNSSKKTNKCAKQILFRLTVMKNFMQLFLRRNFSDLGLEKLYFSD